MGRIRVVRIWEWLAGWMAVCRQFGNGDLGILAGFKAILQERMNRAVADTDRSRHIRLLTEIYVPRTADG